MRKSKEHHNAVNKSRDNLMNGLFSDTPEFSFYGNTEVVIEGSKGVLEYSEELIRINTTTGLVCFEGRGLNLKCISPSELIISGFITNVSFVL